MIEELLRKDRIIFNMKAKTKDEALQELIEPLNLSEERKKVVLEALRKREAIGSTGIGHGIAIPHTRSVVLDSVSLVVGRSKEGVDFDALDGKPVHLFFLLVAPPNDPGTKYLITLGEVARMAKKLIENNAYLEAKDEDEFFKILKKVAGEI